MVVGGIFSTERQPFKKNKQKVSHYEMMATVKVVKNDCTIQWINLP